MPKSFLGNYFIKNFQINLFPKDFPMKVTKAKCGASNPPAHKPKMNMGGYMKIEKPKKLGAYGGGYMKKKSK